MKILNAIILISALTICTAGAQVEPIKLAAAEHGGGNGGDDTELELKKKSLQIGYFLKSEVGKKVFRIINGEEALEVIERTDIDVVSGNVIDKYGTIRTCVNESEKSLITCNLERLNEMKRNNQNDILTAVLFHEILGIMGLELGHQDNVSMYPISSRILPYEEIISSTPISEANIRPEYFGLDSRSYGLTLINKETKESIRLICLNSNVEVHRCRSYSVVRNANGLQAPLVSGLGSISNAKLSAITLNNIKTSDLIEAEKKLERIKDEGFTFLSLRGEVCDEYRYGLGAVQDSSNCRTETYPIWAIFIMGEVDTVVEAGKQVGNLVIWPIKSIVNGIRLFGTKSKINNLNKKIAIARDILNLNNELSLVGKTKTVKSDAFNTVVTILTQAISK